MQTFKRASTAYAAAGKDQPILVIRSGGETLYIVGVDRSTSIDLYSQEKRHGISSHESRVITGHIGLGHLDRLSNANGAYAAEPSRYSTFDHKGLLHLFHNPDHQATYAAACLAEKEAK